MPGEQKQMCVSPNRSGSDGDRPLPASHVGAPPVFSVAWLKQWVMRGGAPTFLGLIPTRSSRDGHVELRVSASPWTGWHTRNCRSDALLLWPQVQGRTQIDRITDRTQRRLKGDQSISGSSSIIMQSHITDTEIFLNERTFTACQEAMSWWSTTREAGGVQHEGRGSKLVQKGSNSAYQSSDQILNKFRETTDF